jgi:hypothetical protein
MATLSREKVVDQWFALVQGGAGKDTWVMNETERIIKSAAPPVVTCAREIVSAGMFGEKRNYLVAGAKFETSAILRS